METLLKVGSKTLNLYFRRGMRDGVGECVVYSVIHLGAYRLRERPPDGTVTAWRPHWSSRDGCLIWHLINV